jgi:hypothetical protein
MNFTPNKWWPPVVAWIAVCVTAFFDAGAATVIAIFALIVSVITD